MKPVLLALTAGEPGGIAGEITIAAWRALASQHELVFFVIGDFDYFSGFANGISLQKITSPEQAYDIFSTALPVLHQPLKQQARPGQADSANAAAVLSSIETGVDLAIAGKVEAIVTNPIQKESLYNAGFKFEGHTDFLADLAKKRGKQANPVMMLSAKDLRTVPITVHIAIADVPHALTTDLIIEKTRVTAHDLAARFDIEKPAIAMTGLNPHAGEGGAMGHEEETVITPAINALRKNGLDVTGPLPADTLFHEQARAGFDVIMCMYHDQALIPVKTLDFHGGVNTTLGLPFVRTSPDHGTALNLAGKGVANPSSLIGALGQAAQMAARTTR